MRSTSGFLVAPRAPALAEPANRRTASVRTRSNDRDRCADHRRRRRAIAVPCGALARKRAGRQPQRVSRRRRPMSAARSTRNSNANVAMLRALALDRDDGARRDRRSAEPVVWPAAARRVLLPAGPRRADPAGRGLRACPTSCAKRAPTRSFASCSSAARRSFRPAGDPSTAWRARSSALRRASSLYPPLLDYCAPVLPGIGRSPFASLLRAGSAARARRSSRRSRVLAGRDRRSPSTAAAPRWRPAPQRRAAFTGVVGLSFDSAALLRSLLGDHRALTLSCFTATPAAQLTLIGRAKPARDRRPPRRSRSAASFGEGWVLATTGTPDHPLGAGKQGRAGPDRRPAGHAAACSSSTACSRPRAGTPGTWSARRPASWPIALCTIR